jgi:hypothetical protein
MTPSSRAEAKAFIDELRKKNGGLTQEQRERLGREFPDALNVIDNLRRQLGASTKTCVYLLHHNFPPLLTKPFELASPPTYMLKTHVSSTNSFRMPRITTIS